MGEVYTIEMDWDKKHNLIKARLYNAKDVLAYSYLIDFWEAKEEFLKILKEFEDDYHQP